MLEGVSFESFKSIVISVKCTDFLTLSANKADPVGYVSSFVSR